MTSPIHESVSLSYDPACPLLNGLERSISSYSSYGMDRSVSSGSLPEEKTCGLCSQALDNQISQVCKRHLYHSGCLQTKWWESYKKDPDRLCPAGTCRLPPDENEIERRVYSQLSPTEEKKEALSPSREIENSSPIDKPRPEEKRPVWSTPFSPIQEAESPQAEQPVQGKGCCPGLAAIFNATLFGRRKFF